MLSEKQISIIIEKMKPFNPAKIGVFGSVARGEDTDESDIDILYDFNSQFTLFDLAGLQIQLEEALNREVDLVDFGALHPKLMKHILSDMKIVYEG